MALRIEPFGRHHRALVGDFQNQHASLVDYLKRFALRHTEKDLLARTYLALEETAGTIRVAGYFSLSTVSVARASVTQLPALDRLPRFPVPGVLLARLAVDARVQGQGLGRYLLEEALGLTLQLAGAGPVGFRLLVTDAIDADAARFYERFGLVRLSEEYPCRMVLDLRPRLATSP
jgi:GNAT superfamily N-acetyltransferase